MRAKGVGFSTGNIPDVEGPDHGVAKSNAIGRGLVSRSASTAIRAENGRSSHGGGASHNTSVAAGGAGGKEVVEGGGEHGCCGWEIREVLMKGTIENCEGK
jgi:hypothetical protein